MTEEAVKQGDTVAVEYTGTLEDGKVFDSSVGKDPIEFTVGEHKVIKGFEDGLVGMKVGEEKEINIDPKDGYGERNDSYIKKVPRSSIPEKLELKKGMVLMFKREDDMRIPANVTEIGDEEVTIDFNHPLSGQKLIFKVKLIKIK